jgi:ferredoxin-NADP reductase
VRIALREGSQSTYKKALALVEPGQELAVTGVWGDFVLPARASAPVLMVAAGIGVTPFASQLRDLRRSGEDRDVVRVRGVGCRGARLPRRPGSRRHPRHRVHAQ